MNYKHSSASIYHDIEKDVYYRIDKRTGKEQRSHKNGMTLHSFKLDVSGTDYKKRRDDENVPEHRMPKKKTGAAMLKPIQMGSQKVFLHLEDGSPKNSSSHQRIMVRAQSNVTSQRLKSQQSQANFLTNFNPHAENSFELKHSNHINAILKNFSKINQEKIYENHCSFDKASGTIVSPKVRVNSKGFRQTKNIIYRPDQQKKKLVRQTRVTPHHDEQSRSSWSRQISKERKLFFEFNPNFKNNERSTKLLNDTLEKNKNIKKLERLFLDETGKVTNQIYQ